MEIFEEGQYNFLSLKEIVVTDSFMGLNKETKNCQTVEAYDKCKTQSYIQNLRQECGCLPISLRIFEKVKFNIIEPRFLYKNVTGYFMHDKGRS